MGNELKLELGNVRNLDAVRGIGFIEPEDGPALPFYLRELARPAAVRPGHLVMFETSLGERGRMATRVKAL